MEIKQTLYLYCEQDGIVTLSRQGRSDRKLTNKEAARQCRQRKKTREEELKRVSGMFCVERHRLIHANVHTFRRHY